MSLPPRPPARRPCCVAAAQIWGVGFWAVLFAECVVSLAPRAIDPFRKGGVSGGQWLAYVVIALGIWICEGLGALGRSFSPLLVRRARELGPSSSLCELLLSPGFVAGLFAARPARLAKSWLLIAVLVPGLAATVPFMPYPWRSMVDAGVVLGLGWGTAVIVVHSMRVILKGRWPEVSPDLPAGRTEWPEAKEGSPAVEGILPLAA
mmetsp:Transcript_35620/g.96617  ORF Transcript_35620/g.96617 Transcript_35620/m.96617 type:complete len:206 (-) Transcript_35620:100-717(-)